MIESRRGVVAALCTFGLALAATGTGAFVSGAGKSGAPNRFLLAAIVTATVIAVAAFYLAPQTFWREEGPAPAARRGRLPLLACGVAGVFLSQGTGSLAALCLTLLGGALIGLALALAYNLTTRKRREKILDRFAARSRRRRQAG